LTGTDNAESFPSSRNVRKVTGSSSTVSDINTVPVRGSISRWKAHCPAAKVAAVYERKITYFHAGAYASQWLVTSISEDPSRITVPASRTHLMFRACRKLSKNHSSGVRGSAGKTSDAGAGGGAVSSRVDSHELMDSVPVIPSLPSKRTRIVVDGNRITHWMPPAGPGSECREAGGIA
jgi:hypothetical protein